MTLKNNKLYLFLIALLPASIVIGPSISLLNIIFLSLIFLLFDFKSKFNEFKNEKVVIVLFLIFLYLIFNLIVSYDFKSGIYRSFGFSRFILLFFVINYFFLKKENEKVLFFWLLVISIVTLDSYVEFFLGQNLFGYGGADKIYGDRIVSFFKDEPIVGAYLNGFIFIILGYLFNLSLKSKSYKNFILLFVSIIFIICIILTGERSNGIKATIGFLLFFSLIKNFNIKIKLSFLVSLLVILFFTISNSNWLKARYYTTFYLQIFDENMRSSFLENSLYLKHYRSGIEVFKNNFFFGVGNKNYRVVTCLPGDQKKEGITKNYFCGTHPHQLYIEFISEHGLFGTIILLSLIFFLIFKNLRIIIVSRNSLQIGCFVYLIINFIPLLPSGSFFNDFNATLFWINLSIMYACNEKTNIFSRAKNL